MIVLLLAVSLFGPLSIAPAIAQDEAPAEVAAEQPSAEAPATTDQTPVEPPAAVPAAQEQVQRDQQAAAPASPLTGSLEIRLTGTNGVGLNGLFALTDASGAYHEGWTESGVALFPALVAGTATVSQVSGAIDYSFDGATPSYIDVPAGGHAALPIVNAFLDADGDGVGDSVDVCGTGSDAVDTDADLVPDACDATPNGDDDADGVDNASDACPAGDDAVDTDADGIADACDDTPAETLEETSEETSEIVAEVASEPEVVEEAPVTCKQADAVVPWIATDLADYPPGARVTLTGGNWVAGQTIEILVEDDGVADAERGPWSHTATVTADAQGAFTYQFDLAPWFVAAYSVVATGECSKAETTFTDAFTVVSATVNGAASTTVGPSTSVTAAMTISLTAAGDVWRGTSWRYGSSGAITCVNQSDFSGVASHTAHFSITSPSSGGEYDVTFRAHTTNDCSGAVAASRTLTKGVVVSTDRSGTATINPTTATAGATAAQFAITITNTTSGDSIASARIAIPAGFTNVQIVSITVSGNNWSANTATVPFISLQANNNGSAPLVNGEPLTVTFTANAPTTSGNYLWGTQAWKNTDFTSSSFAINAQPMVTVIAAQTACTPTIGATGLNLDFGSSTWSGSAYPTRTGALAIQIQSSGSGCSGFPTNWSVQASTAVMNRSGGGGTIPATAISYSGTSSGSPPIGLTPSSAKALSGTAQVIATGIATTSTGTWNAAFSLAPPATAPPGSYSGTITITAATSSP